MNKWWRRAVFYVFLMCFGVLPGSTRCHIDTNHGLSFRSKTVWKSFGSYRHRTKRNDCCTLRSVVIIRSKYARTIQGIGMHWVGAPLAGISTSLYTKADREALMPIEEQLAADGTWSQKRQIATFQLDDKVVATRSYYLVIYHPNHLQNAIRHGRFVVTNVTSKAVENETS